MKRLLCALSVRCDKNDENSDEQYSLVTENESTQPESGIAALNEKNPSAA